MFKPLLKIVVLACALLSHISFAAFPDDFSGVTWIDPNISGWSQTSSLTVSVNPTTTRFTHTKQASWPNSNHSIVGRCCNASVWVFIKRNGQWYASTFEYLRPNTPTKSTSALDGRHLKRAPFLVGGFDWKPANGEVYGFMVSGFARFNLNDVNIAERSNVAFFKWGSGPTNADAAKNFTEVPRNPDGSPSYTPVPPPPEEQPEPEPEECVPPITPAPEINTHIYTGPATGTVVVSTPVEQTTLNYTEQVTVTVSDDRSVSFAIDDESFNATVAQDGTFTGTFTFNVLNQCLVNITVNGLISGTSATGSSSGTESCTIGVTPVTAVFNASFNATSATVPDYVDERGPASSPANTCNATKVLSIIPLLLD